MNYLTIFIRKPLLEAQPSAFCARLFLSTKSREGKFLDKIMNRHKPKRKFYNLDGFEALTPARDSSYVRPINHRRMSILNKLFMKNITEVMATGTTSASIEGLGIDISKVSITSDFQNINVLFVCKANPRPPDLEKTLEDVGYSLRHDLSQLKLMGVVPRINFQEDKTLKRLMEIESLLTRVDKSCSEEDDATNDSSTEEILAAKRASSGFKGTHSLNILEFPGFKGNPSENNQNSRHMVKEYLKKRNT